MDEQLHSQMEHLRNEMVEMALRYHLQHVEVLMLSQSLDELIVQVQREWRARNQAS